jgi:cobalamin biosynthesis Co2+ chelatase CbiK
MDLFIFLNKIIKRIPIENSKAAKPIMNKLVEINVRSSFIEPLKIVYTYNVNQVISEYNNSLKKFSILTIKPIIVNQKKKFQKFIHVCKKLFL